MRHNMPGWNDPPAAPVRRTPVPSAPAVVPPITNPLPNSTPVQNPPFYGQTPSGPANIPPPRAGSASIPPPPKANAVPPPPKANAAPPMLVTSHSQPGYGSRPGSAANYDLRPPSTGPQAGGRYAPPPRAESAGLGEQTRTSIPPPPPKQGNFAAPLPPMARGPYAPPLGTSDASHGTSTSVPPPPRAGAPPVVRGGSNINNPYGPSPSSQPAQPASQPPPPPAAVTQPPKSVAPKYRKFRIFESCLLFISRLSQRLVIAPIYQNP
jgi:hypothetical protein